jgi:NAD-dependent SIR2 family protein deacetylase
MISSEGSQASGIHLPCEKDVDDLAGFITSKQHLIAITGAGTSTASGIPDYRGPQGSYHKGHKPMTHQEFMHSDIARRRYWARSMFGWSQFPSAQPNAAHYSLANLQSMGYLKTKKKAVVFCSVSGWYHTEF